MDKIESVEVIIVVRHGVKSISTTAIQTKAKITVDFVTGIIVSS